MPGLDFGYNYDGLGNRLSASKGTPALVTEYEPDAMNRYARITDLDNFSESGHRWILLATFLPTNDDGNLLE